MAGQGSTGNVIAALASFFIPGLGQLMQGRLLKAAGANDEVLRKIMVDNPRRFLAFVPKRGRKK